tara:strand:+ start:6107 stop:6541 length:435 start_codon:yes stop_codon:yes gene_type:complete
MNDILKHEAMAAVEEFIVERNKMLKFIEKHSAFFDTLNALVDNYNGAHEAAKASIKEIPSTDGFQMGPFRRTKTSEKTKYDPDKLPTKALRLKGVVKVDAEALNKHIERGNIAYKDVAEARGEYRTTGAVNGPKLMVKPASALG